MIYSSHLDFVALVSISGWRTGCLVDFKQAEAACRIFDTRAGRMVLTM